MTAPQPRRTFPNMRWWHKWIGFAIGVLMFAWVASGIVMLLPPTASATGAGVVKPALDLSTVAITPARAAQVALASRSESEATAQARSISLQVVLGTPVYVVVPTRGEPVLVTATSGELFPITAERAASIVSEAKPGEKPVKIERILSTQTGYYGRVPAFRVQLGDAAHTVGYVAEATGALEQSERRDRVMQNLGHSLHVFLPLGQLPGGQNTRKITLILTGIVGLLSVLSGYWLWFPKRWLKRRS